MLVLSRKRGEKIMIGDNVLIEVVEVDRGKVRLGFTAPVSVPVARLEVYNRERLAEIERAERCE